jgi:hypothetical protein
VHKGISNIIEYNSAEALKNAAKEKKLVVFIIAKPPAYYFMYKAGLE